MLGLINDLKDFVSYGWDEPIWIKILYNLKGELRRKVCMHKKKPPNKKTLESYKLYGFSFAFQVSNTILLIMFCLVICLVIVVLLLTLFLLI